MVDADLAIERTGAHATLRAEVRDIMEADRLSMAALAREIGVPNGTFNPWMNDSYQGDNDRIALQVRNWIDGRPARERVRSAMPQAPEWVETPTSRIFHATLEHCQFMPDLGAIIGAPGVGKTSAVRRYQQTRPNCHVVTAEPCGGSPRAMMEMICEALKIPVQSVGAQKLSASITRKLSGGGALLIIDEAQHLSPQAMDQLRTIYDRAGCGVALVGSEGIFVQLDGQGRRTYAQLTSRVGMRSLRAKPTAEDVAALLDAWEVRDPKQRRVLGVIAAKPGALRQMNKTLRFAYKLAIADDRSDRELRVEHIEAAFGRLYGADEYIGQGAGK